MIHKTLALLILSMGINAVAAHAAPSVVYNAASCISTEGPAAIRAALTSPTAQSARVYFRAENGPSDYYVDMVKSAGDVWAVLPRAAADTTAIMHRIVVTGADGVEQSTASIRIPVGPGCPASALSAEEIQFSKNLVIGLTENAQMEIPDGFDCSGITSEITADGIMKPHAPCAQQLTDLKGKKGTSGFGKAVRNPVVIGILGAAVSGIAISSSNDSSSNPVSSARP